MPIDIPLVESAIADELLQIGIIADTVGVTVLDASTTSFVVTIVSASFEDQTYLDRELRLRPAIARAFSSQHLQRSAYVIDPLTPAELEANVRIPAESVPDSAEDPIERLSRADWRTRQGVVARALTNCGYSVEPLSDQSVYLATRRQLSEERVLIGFALSPRAATVDLEVRKIMQTAYQSQRFSTAYYLAPSSLQNPFANQHNASWLTVTTDVGFLHTLNSSSQVARKLAALCNAALSGKDALTRGPVIQPDVKAVGNPAATPNFFDTINSWLPSDRAACLVVIAPAGHGKTTLCLELTRRLAERFLEDPASPLPLLVEFEAVRRAVDFDALVHKRLAELGAGTFGALAELLKLNRAILIVDGFDELADDAGMEVAETQVRSLRSTIQGCAKVVLAGRTIFTHHFSRSQGIEQRMRGLLGDVDVQVLDILPFDSDQIELYVDTREGLSSVQKQRLKEFASASPDTASLCSNPLFLRILSSLAAGGHLPAPDDVASGIEILIGNVCDREEERQHLGIGQAGQMTFLRWLARDTFRLGTGALSVQDIQLIAALSSGESQASQSGDIVTRLLDHALLQSRGDEKVGFIHPFVRDVILGIEVMSEIQERKTHKWNGDIATTAGVRDLPETTVRELARRRDDVFENLRPYWLTDSAGLTSQERRNFFRVAVRSAMHSDSSPREWHASTWTRDGAIRCIDASNLILEHLSFDRLVLGSCDLTGTWFSDCDFRGTTLDGGTLVRTVFDSCRGDPRTRVKNLLALDALVFTEADGGLVRDGDQLLAQLTRDFHEEEAPTGEQVPIRRRTEELARLVLSTLATDDGRFHAVERSQMMAHGDQTAREALQRVIVPMVANRMCVEADKHVGGMKVLYELQKRWRRSVVAFLQNRGISRDLREVFAGMAARAGRFLS